MAGLCVPATDAGDYSPPSSSGGFSMDMAVVFEWFGRIRVLASRRTAARA